MTAPDPERMLAEIDAWSVLIRNQPPHPARLEVGTAVMASLLAYAGTPSPDDQVSAGTRALTGIPVLVREDIDPRAWRFLDQDGDELSGGLA